MAILDVIRFDGLKSREWLIYKYPSDKIVLGSQLIVQEGQVALFVKGGTVCDVFNPGTYTLHSNNLPILQSIVNLPFGGETPFSAEVYFLNTTVKLDINWGTTDPIQLIDPKYFVRLHIRAFGQMALRVSDPSFIFKELIGGLDKKDFVRFDVVKDYFRGVLVLKVKSLISECIINEQVSALEISTQLEPLSVKVKERITPEFERFGFLVSNFFIQSINFPDEDFEQINQILQDKAAFEIMGDGRYATKRSFDVYEGAANNSNGVAGAFAAGGIGYGAAMGMGMTMNANMGNPMMGAQGYQQPMQQPVSQPQQPVQAAPVSEAIADENKVCPSCNAVVSASTKFCPECGADLRKKICECGHELEAGSKFCPECGKKVD